MADGTDYQIMNNSKDLFDQNRLLGISKNINRFLQIDSGAQQYRNAVAFHFRSSAIFSPCIHQPARAHIKTAKRKKRK